MRRTTLPVSAAALAVAGILLAGCSDDDPAADSAPTIGDPPPASELAEDAKTGAEEGAEGEPGVGSTEGTEDGSGEGSDGGAEVPEGWLVITDEPSGISVAMPQDVQPAEQEVPLADGTTITTRSYLVTEGEPDPQNLGEGEVQVGFNVLDRGGRDYDLDSGAESVASSLLGEVIYSDPITVDGYDGVDSAVKFGAEQVSMFELIVVGDFVLQPSATGAYADLELIDQLFDQVLGSIDLPQ